MQINKIYVEQFLCVSLQWKIQFVQCALKWLEALKKLKLLNLS